MKFLTNKLTLVSILACLISFNSHAQELEPNSLDGNLIIEKKKVKRPNLANKIQGGLSGVKAKRKKMTSLMFDKKEYRKIEKALYAYSNDQVYTPDAVNKENSDETKESSSEINKKSYVYLASILYFGEKHWAAWINDEKITSDFNKKENEFYLHSVSTEKATVVWSISASKWRVLMGKRADSMESRINENNQVVVEFELRPNQTFVLGSETVVEGANVIASEHKPQMPDLLEEGEEENKDTIEPEAESQEEREKALRSQIEEAKKKIAENNLEHEDF